MIDVLNLIVEELVKEDLTVQELESLSVEISKNSGLVDSLRENSYIDFTYIELSSGKSQPLRTI